MVTFGHKYRYTNTQRDTLACFHAFIATHEIERKKGKGAQGARRKLAKSVSERLSVQMHACTVDRLKPLSLLLGNFDTAHKEIAQGEVRKSARLVASQSLAHRSTFCLVE